MIDRDRLSPMMKHYLQMKDENEGCILFYRLGDFYEMFFEDAVLVSKELELTLTGKDCGLDERAPMCGVPYHAADTYIGRLVKLGYRVAICEQVQDPKEAKGLVERKVIRIVTPGTAMSRDAVQDDSNNYIMSVYGANGLYGIAVSDISTGSFSTTQVESPSKIIDEIVRFNPSEIILKLDQNPGKEFTECYEDIRKRTGMVESPANDRYYDIKVCTDKILKQMKVSSIEGLGLKDYPGAVIASGALLQYLLETQMDLLKQINHIDVYFISEYMIVDSSTKRNLELLETMRDKTKRGSLVWILDKTKTAMGSRLLKSYVDMPLLSISEIEKRYDAIDSLNINVICRDEMREYLNSVYDLERLMSRIAMKTANPRDLISFRTSLYYLPFIRNILSELSGGIFKEMHESFDALEDIYELLQRAIDDDAPLTVKEGGIFKDGYSAEIDDLKNKKTNSKALLAEIEAREKEATGIKNLRIKYNHVFGYFFEVTNSFKELVPDYFIRKQTLTNAERFTTDELSRMSDEILGAEDKLYGIEYEEFCRLRDYLESQIVRVQKTAKQIAEMDVLASLSYVSMNNDYVRPHLNENGVIDIKGGRHPVVERLMGDDSFIPNDTYLDNTANRISIITGPNMAGKSTYMRQTALICLMAQMGCFVPADSADIAVSDRIFTRVGASDDLAQGQSTFMVEMSEVANILRNATANSLIIMDEIGRGTSTFDGLSIAWAVVEFIADKSSVGAKTLFATHYHELTELEGKLSSVNNYCIAIKQEGDHLVFLRKIIRGGADRSYGIEVAKLAGIPETVIDRAREISDFLVDEDITGKAKNIDIVNTHKPKKEKKDDGQLSLFASQEDMSVTAELRALDLNNMTPVKAMLYLQELKDRLS